MKSSGNIYGKGLKAKATKLHSVVVRARGKCERCGQSDYSKLQTAHIVPRRYAATRCDETAAWCLCAACHMRLTEWPSEHVDFAHASIGVDAYEALCRKAQDGVKTNDAFWAGEIERLSALLAQVEAS